MGKTLLCSHDPLLIKSFYGLFREEGFIVDLVDHPSFAIKRVMEGDIELFIMDAATFGLSVKETIEIIRNVAPDLPCIVVGNDQNGASPAIERYDLERLRSLLRAIKGPEISIYKGVKNETERNYN